MYRNQEFFHRMPYGGCSSSSDRYQNQITPYSSHMNYLGNNEIWRQQQHNNFNMSFNDEFYNEDLSLSAALEIREQDENMIENFLKDNEKTEDAKKVKDKEDSAFTIVDTRNMASGVYKLIKELKESLNELRDNRDMPETEWRIRIEIIERKKSEINEFLDKLEDDKLLKKVKTNLDKRKRKRLREKKQRAFRKIEKQSANERRIELHARADAWIKDKQNIIEKEKQEVSMRKDADIVLAEVRGKRNDARKFLSMLQEIGNLRRIKVNIARGRGENLSKAADEAFTNIIDKLLEQWTAMDREYSIEEQGLKLMLKTDNEEKIEKQKRNIFDDWENAIFGRKLTSVDNFQRDVDRFVAIRAAWDTYISYDGLGSPIPIGWVMPDPPSSAAWQKYLKKE